jgi:hypothetical protein
MTLLRLFLSGLPLNGVTTSSLAQTPALIGLAAHDQAAYDSSLAEQGNTKADTFKTLISEDQPLHTYFCHHFLPAQPGLMSLFNTQLNAQFNAAQLPFRR